jgi:hypothetical protein
MRPRLGFGHRSGSSLGEHECGGGGCQSGESRSARRSAGASLYPLFTVVGRHLVSGWQMWVPHMFISLLSAYCSIELRYRVEYREDAVHSNGIAVFKLVCAAAGMASGEGDRGRRRSGTVGSKATLQIRSKITFRLKVSFSRCIRKERLGLTHAIINSWLSNSHRTVRVVYRFGRYPI